MKSFMTGPNRPALFAGGTPTPFKSTPTGTSTSSIPVHETSESDHALAVFDPHGNFIRSWGSQFAGGAHGMQLRREDGEDFLYLTDIRRSIVQKTDLDGNVLLTLGYPTESPAYQRDEERRAAFWKPTNAAVASNGDIYVADGYGASYVVVFDRDGRYKNNFGGGRTDQPGDLFCPAWNLDRRPLGRGGSLGRGPDEPPPAVLRPGRQSPAGSGTGSTCPATSTSSATGRC